MSIQSNFPNLKPSLLLDFANTKQLDNRVTFTRSTSAVYYDGKTTAMAEQNLLVQSQNSTTNWTVTNNTATLSATTAPDGTSTALSLVPTTTSTDEHLFYQSFTGTDQAYTFSVYAKTNGYNWVYLRPQIVSSLLWASFDLSTGTIGTVSSGITATITSVGNGWYRCTATRTLSANTCYFVVGVANADNHPTFAGNGTSGIYVWGAQVEQRSAATAYTATTTQPITNYIPVLLTAGGNQPRFDCNPTTGESLGLLIEEQRTNIALSSSDYANTGVWVTYNASVTSNNNVAPDGSLTADTVIPNTTNVAHDVYQGITTANATTYTYSVYVKANGYTLFNVRTYGSSAINVVYNLSNQTIDSSSGTNSGTTITSIGNGWYRLTLTFVSSSTTTYISTQPTASGYTVNTGNTIFAGNGFSGAFVWGAQLETGAFPTSYIATSGASATRTADSASMTGANFSSWFNKGEGTIIYNTSSGQYIQDARLFWQLDNGVSNYLQIMYANYSFSGTYYPPLIIPTGGTSTGPNLNAFAFNTTSSAASTNGGSVSVGSGLTYDFSSAARFTFGATNIPISKMAFYPKKLTNTNLQALTS